MSYQVIARKWRPQSFQELVGQEAISQTLLNALRSDRIPHAMLFTGTRGVGKTSSARILAKALRCPDAKDFVPCNVCSDCKEISSGSSVNVIEIDGASNNGVDAIRELRDSVGYMPSSGKFKIYIIDEVHMLSTSAFNALLKTLEEPPSHVIFIFATTEVQKIPITVLSRCQRFDFRSISTTKISEHLKNICTKESIQFEEEALWLIARQANGSMRDGLSLLDQAVSFCDKNLKYEKIVDVLGLTDRQLILDSLQAIANRQPDTVIEIIERIRTTGTDVKIFGEELLEEIRNLLILKISPAEAQAKLLDLPQSEIDVLTQMANDFSSEEIHMLFDMALKGGNDIPKASKPILVLEMCLLRMSAAPTIHQIIAGDFSSPSSEKKKTLINQSTDNSSTKQETKPSVAPISEASKPSLEKNTEQPNKTQSAPFTQANEQKNTPETSTFSANRKIEISYLNDLSLEENWLRFADYAKKKIPILAAKLEHCVPISLEENKFKLGIRKRQDFLRQQLDDNDTILKVQKLLIQSGWCENIEKTDFISIEDSMEEGKLSPAELIDRKKNKAKNELQRRIKENPLIQKTMETFNAKITSVREKK